MDLTLNGKTYNIFDHQYVCDASADTDIFGYTGLHRTPTGKFLIIGELAPARSFRAWRKGTYWPGWCDVTYAEARRLVYYEMPEMYEDIFA